MGRLFCNPTSLTVHSAIVRCNMMMEVVEHYKNILEQLMIHLLTTTTDTMMGTPRMTLCSAPTLVTGDYQLVAEDMMEHDNDTLIDDGSEGRAGFKLVAAASGSGDECCPPVVDSSTWLTVVGGMAVVVWFLRETIIAEIMGRRRRNIGNKVGILLRGLEDFEGDVEEEDEKIKQSWILSAIKEIIDIKNVVEKESEIKNTESGLYFEPEESIENRCRLEVWRCMSTVMEDAVKNINKSQGLWSLVQSALTRLVFHGSKVSMWNSLMTIPQVRSAGQCVRLHDKCVAEMIVREAAQEDRKRLFSVNTDWSQRKGGVL